MVMLTVFHQLRLQQGFRAGFWLKPMIKARADIAPNCSTSDNVEQDIQTQYYTSKPHAWCMQ